jgi:hypothetical protein
MARIISIPMRCQRRHWFRLLLLYGASLLSDAPFVRLEVFNVSHANIHHC